MEPAERSATLRAAIRHLSAIRRTPAHAVALTLGWAHILTGDGRQARAVLESALRCLPTTAPSRLALSANLATAFLVEGQLTEALRRFDELRNDRLLWTGIRRDLVALRRLGIIDERAAHLVAPGIPPAVTPSDPPRNEDFVEHRP